MKENEPREETEIPQRIKDSSLQYAETAIELYNFPQDVGIAFEKGAISEWKFANAELQSLRDQLKHRNDDIKGIVMCHDEMVAIRDNEIKELKEALSDVLKHWRGLDDIHEYPGCFDKAKKLIE